MINLHTSSLSNPNVISNCSPVSTSSGVAKGFAGCGVGTNTVGWEGGLVVVDGGILGVVVPTLFPLPLSLG